VRLFLEILGIFIASATFAFGGVGVMTLGPADFFWARICFIVAVGIPWAYLMLLLLLRWEVSPRTKIILGTINIGISAFLIYAAMAWISAHAQSPAPPTPSGGINVGHDNNGQVCTSGANCTFTQPPAPAPLPMQTAPCSSIGQQGGTQTFNCTFQGKPAQIRVLGQMAAKDNTDGTFTVPVMIDVHPQIPLVVTACGDGVISIELGIWTGMMTGTSREQPAPNNCKAAFYDGVYGQWAANVTVKSKASQFQLFYSDREP
jgi:hypothetical protein